MRQYFPKGTNLNGLTDEALQVIEDKLNDRPRKTSGFKAPSEVFFASFKRRTSSLNPPSSGKVTETQSSGTSPDSNSTRGVPYSPPSSSTSML